MYHYCAYNLAIESEIELPHLPPSPGGADVIIRHSCRDSNAGPPPNMACSFHVTPRLATLDYAGLGTLVVRDGAQVSVKLLPEADEGRLPYFLSGTAMAVLLYQRGYMVLRASAVSIHGTAAVLMAGTREGKSSLAAWLCQQGHSLLADDITAIDMRPRYPVVVPATPALMLDPETVLAFGQDTTLLRPLYAGERKYVSFPVADRFAEVPAPLSVIYDIQTGSDNNISYIPLQMGLAAIMRNSYPGCLLQPGGREHLHQCSRLVGAVAICELNRRLDRSDLPELGQMIEGHIASLTLAGSRGRP